MRWFPVQNEALHTAEAPEQARETILRSKVKLISCIYHAEEPEEGRICMTPVSDLALFADSFVPLVTAIITEERSGSRISLSGELLRSVKILMMLFRSVLAIFAVTALIFAESAAVRIAMLGLILFLTLFLEGISRLFSYLRFQSFLREFQSECIK